VRSVHESASTIRSLLGDDSKDAQTLLGALPVAVQRVESSAFRTGSGGQSEIGTAYASRLSTLIRSLTSGVHIVAPSTNSYTLASNSSKLPITVENDLAYTVNVQIRIATVGDIPGFIARPPAAKAVGAHSKLIVQVPTTVQRAGQLQILAVLQAPDGHSIGEPITLRIHSTALGTIGLLITIVAGSLLVLALVVRLIRTLLRRRRRAAPAVTP
jgi:hypothetical protein